MNNHKSEDKDQILVDLLKRSAAQGLNFAQAKQELLSQGYSEEEIDLVTDQHQYGSSPRSSAPNKVAEYYQAHPEQAVEAGAKLLAAQRKEDLADARRKALLDGMAASAAGRLGAPGVGIQVEYESRFAHDIGVSFWVLVGLGVALDRGTYYLVHSLHWHHWVYAATGALNLLIIVFLIKRMR